MSDEEQPQRTDVMPQRFEDDELGNLLHNLVKRKGLVGAAKALGVNFRTLTGSMDSGKLSRRMRAALVKVAQIGDSDDGAEQGGNAERQIESVMGQVESLVAEVLSIREELNALAKRIGELERRMSEPSTSPGPGTASKSVVEEGAPKVASSPSPGHGLPTLVVAMEPQPYEQEAFGAAVPLITEWRRLRTVAYVGYSRVERTRRAERRWGLEIEMIEEFGLALPPETEPLPKSRRDTHLGWRKEALDRARKERIRAERVRCLRRVLTLGLWWR